MNYRNDLGCRITGAVAGLAILLFAVPAMYSFLESRRDRVPDTREWPTAAGWITRSEFTSFDGDATLTLVYNYIIDGEEFSSSRLRRYHYIKSDAERKMSTSSAKSYVDRYPVGTEMAIHYDPEDPRRAVLETREPAGSISQNLATAGIVILGYTVFLIPLIPETPYGIPNRSLQPSSDGRRTRVYYDPDAYWRNFAELAVVTAWSLLTTSTLFFAFVEAGAMNWAIGLGIPTAGLWIMAVEGSTRSSEPDLETVSGDPRIRHFDDEDDGPDRKLQVGGKEFEISTEFPPNLLEKSGLLIEYWPRENQYRIVRTIWELHPEPDDAGDGEAEQDESQD